MLSAQQVTSCAMANGCNGGYMSTALAYIRDVGLTTEANYGYTATQNNCNTPNSRPYSISSYSRIDTDGSCDAFATYLQNHGPIVVGMAIYSSFFSYDSGVYSCPVDANDYFCGHHAMVAVGHDATEGSILLQNSWGTSWGDNGFIKVTTNQNQNGYVCYYYSYFSTAWEW